jgi:hypothetical protein
MEWISDDPIKRTTTLLFYVVLVITVVGVWFGRKRLALTIPCALIFLLSAILVLVAIPSYFPARPMAHRNACINNLRQIRDAKIEWARKNHKLPTDVPAEAELVGTNKFLHSMPVCPGGGTYTFGAVNQNPSCSLAEHGHKLE